jgi:hypothetical protein
MAMMDTSGLGIKPDTFRLDLWTAADGSPVAAQFSATNTAVDGTKLIDIETTYTFSDAGATPTIADPMATPGPSPSAHRS